MESRAMPLSLGSRSGVFGVEILEDVFEPIWEDAPTTQIESMVNDAGEMWVGTPQGLYSLSHDPVLETAKIDMASGLPASNALSLAVSPTTGNLWVGTNGGLAEVDPESHKVVRTVTKQDGLVDNEVWYYGSVFVDEQERVYYGTAKGLTVYNPILDGANGVAPTPRITRVTYRENSWGNNELALEYAALSFANERQVRYQSRLVGYDEDWSLPTDERRIRYTNLPAWVFSREFTFELRATNNDGIVSNLRVSYTVSVSPPWFLRWWAFAVYVLLAGGAIYTYIEHKTRKQAEQLAKERTINERLRRIDRLKDEFLANTSHELRTPLNGIIGIAESMMDGVAGVLSPKAMSNIGLIIASGKRLANLVNDILDFSKLKEHELELRRKAVDVSVLGDIVLRVSEPLIEKKPLVLKNTIPRDLPPALADENRLQQILHNLIGNAIKFTHEGSVTLTGSVADEFVRICVIDTGIGIPAEKQDAIFKSFEQVDASTAREYGGTGLGLAVTKQLVELHGGEVGVESSTEDGSTFFFTLPLADGEAEELEGAEYLRRIQDPSSPEYLEGDAIDGEEALVVTSDGEEFSVLVVDDEPINQQVMANQLSVGNYRVTQAMNGEEALNALSTNEKFDLVLLDVMMPRMSGFEVCNKIREDYLPSELPVIMVTAKNQVSDLVEGLSSGANDYITKPIAKSELLARIKTQLNLQKINAAYGRFVPHEFLKYLNRESIIDVKLGDMVQKEMTIFVSDIRQFTTLSEKMTPEENFEFINAYLAQASPVIRDHGGFIDRYTGDAIMALFPEEAEDAIKASIDTLRLLAEINQVRVSQDELPIEIGIGLHSGSLMLGIVGESERAQGDIFSDAVNLANRIEGLSKLYGASLVVSEETLGRLPADNTYHQRFLGKVQVKGKNEHVSVFEVYDGDPEHMIDLKVATKDDFEEGLDHYFAREFTMASVCFKKVMDANAEDKTANLYLRRSAQFMIQGVPENWEGVEAVDEVGGSTPPPLPEKQKSGTRHVSPHRRQVSQPPPRPATNGGAFVVSNGEESVGGELQENASDRAMEDEASDTVQGKMLSSESVESTEVDEPLSQSLEPQPVDPAADIDGPEERVLSEKKKDKKGKKKAKKAKKDKKKDKKERKKDRKKRETKAKK
jgi:two-component system sensor histidine kinase ChiS